MRVKKIGGLKFALIDEHYKKKLAQSNAQLIRRGGYNARVVKSGKMWQVWREVV